MSTVIDARSWTSEYQDLVDAALAGKTIEVRGYMDGPWMPCGAVSFIHPRDYYRIQPDSSDDPVHRLNAKDTPTTNIDKALWYLNRLKKELET